MPNAAHLHLLLVHLPIVWLLISLLILSYWLHKKDTDIINLSLFMNIIISIIIIPTFLLWWGAVEIVSWIKWISMKALVMHYKFATITLAFTIFLWISSYITHYFNKKKKTRYLYKAVLVLSIAAFILASITWYYWWNIRHTEISDNNTKQVK